jgi:hypothetical protein
VNTLADRAASAQVREFQLAAPLRPGIDGDGCSAVRLLVRGLGRRPIGGLPIEHPGGNVEIDRIRETLMERVVADRNATSIWIRVVARAFPRWRRGQLSLWLQVGEIRGLLSGQRASGAIRRSDARLRRVAGATVNG